MYNCNVSILLSAVYPRVNHAIPGSSVMNIQAAVKAWFVIGETPPVNQQRKSYRTRSRARTHTHTVHSTSALVVKMHWSRFGRCWYDVNQTVVFVCYREILSMKMYPTVRWSHFQLLLIIVLSGPETRFGCFIWPPRSTAVFLCIFFSVGFSQLFKLIAPITLWDDRE